MTYIEGVDRNQITMLPSSIEEYVGEDNPVRVIDAFVDGLNMAELGFERATLGDTGRPPYDPRDLLKLYIYGYFNRIRSSRRLMLENTRNVELFFLLNGVKPDFRTISDFRKNNAKALKHVFKAFVRLCDDLGLYEKTLLAIDGSKFRAVNGNKKMFNEAILRKKLMHIEENITQYLAAMDSADKEESAHSACTKEQIADKLQTLRERRDIYNEYLRELSESAETQKLTTDPEARMMRTKDGFHCCYNVQTAVDAGSHLIAAYEVTNHPNDQGVLSEMADAVRESLGTETALVLPIVADKGYESQEEITKCVMNAVIPHVGFKHDKDERLFTLEYIPNHITPEQQASTAPEDIEKCLHAGVLPNCFDGSVVSVEVQNRSAISCFTRNEDNTVTCPMGEILTPVKKRSESFVYQNMAACRHCPNKCTPGKNYKTVKFGPDTQFVHTWMYGDSTHPPRPAPEGVRPYNAFFQKQPIEEKVVLRIVDNVQLQKDRLGISEHPFGTVKWYHGAHYLLCRGKEKASAEIGLSFLAYNLRRAINMVGVKALMAVL